MLFFPAELRMSELHRCIDRGKPTIVTAATCVGMLQVDWAFDFWGVWSYYPLVCEQFDDDILRDFARLQMHPQLRIAICNALI